MFSHYLMFDNNCAEALDVYASALGAKVTEMQKYGDMPPNPAFPVAEEMKNQVLHARLVWDGTEIMCADAPGRCQSGTNMYISVTIPDGDKVRKAWDILKAGGEIYMELAPTFFAEAHGSLRDRYGVNWMFTVPAAK
jgi:PhnB protein